MEASRDLGQPVAAQTQTLMADLEQVRAACWRQAGQGGEGCLQQTGGATLWELRPDCVWCARYYHHQH